MSLPTLTKQWTVAGTARVPPHPTIEDILMIFRSAGYLTRKSGYSTYDDHDPGDEDRDPRITTTECEPRSGPIREGWLIYEPAPNSPDAPQRWTLVSP